MGRRGGGGVLRGELEGSEGCLLLVHMGAVVLGLPSSPDISFLETFISYQTLPQYFICITGWHIGTLKPML